MDEEKVFIVVVSMFEDEEPTNILTCFKTKERAEKFIQIQKGIGFPYKSYDIIESELN